MTNKTIHTGLNCIVGNLLDWDLNIPCLLKEKLSYNPLYSGGFSHTDKYNKDGFVYHKFQGVTGRHVQMIMYSSHQRFYSS